MSQTVKIKVRANQSVQFPALCVHCAHPSKASLGLKKRIGRITRQIDVPLCDDCRGQLRRLSGEEERVQKLGRLMAGLLFVLTLAIALLTTPAGLSLTLRLLISFSLALFLAEIALVWSGKVRRQAALPVKQAIYESASIQTFSWRATTFLFENEIFCESFKALNESLLMED